ncbi:MAG: hypothetical protein ACXAC2_15280 [Candidatus Kariarchaeaceae archaeon]|jgi:hypothetical protein
MSLAMYIAIGMTTINIILLLILATVYFRNYLEMKAQFSFGLIIFASVLVLDKFIMLYFVIISMKDHADVFGVPVMILESLQLVAFSILTYITVK